MDDEKNLGAKRYDWTTVQKCFVVYDSERERNLFFFWSAAVSACGKIYVSSVSAIFVLFLQMEKNGNGGQNES